MNSEKTSTKINKLIPTTDFKLGRNQLIPLTESDSPKTVINRGFNSDINTDKDARLIPFTKSDYLEVVMGQNSDNNEDQQLITRPLENTPPYKLMEMTAAGNVPEEVMEEMQRRELYKQFTSNENSRDNQNKTIEIPAGAIPAVRDKNGLPMQAVGLTLTGTVIDSNRIASDAEWEDMKSRTFTIKINDQEFKVHKYHDLGDGNLLEVGGTRDITYTTLKPTPSRSLFLVNNIAEALLPKRLYSWVKGKINARMDRLYSRENANVAQKLGAVSCTDDNPPSLLELREKWQKNAPSAEKNLQNKREALESLEYLQDNHPHGDRDADGYQGAEAFEEYLDTKEEDGRFYPAYQEYMKKCIEEGFIDKDSPEWLRYKEFITRKVREGKIDENSKQWMGYKECAETLENQSQISPESRVAAQNKSNCENELNYYIDNLQNPQVPAYMSSLKEAIDEGFINEQSERWKKCVASIDELQENGKITDEQLEIYQECVELINSRKEEAEMLNAIDVNKAQPDLADNDNEFDEELDNKVNFDQNGPNSTSPNVDENDGHEPDIDENDVRSELNSQAGSESPSSSSYGKSFSHEERMQRFAGPQHASNLYNTDTSVDAQRNKKYEYLGQMANSSHVQSSNRPQYPIQQNILPGNKYRISQKFGAKLQHELNSEKSITK